VYKYRASPTVRSIDFIIQMHHSQSSTPQVDKDIRASPQLWIENVRHPENTLRLQECTLPDENYYGVKSRVMASENPDMDQDIID
jgi:hypothetical protein